MEGLISQMDLVARVMSHGAPDRSRAERAVREALALLGAHLTSDEAVALGRCISAELARHLDDMCDDLQPSSEDVQVALRALGDLLDGETLARLTRALPAAVARSLVAPRYGDPPPHANTPGATLATGRPGHSQSVVKSENPHAEDKLSSSRRVRP